MPHDMTVSNINLASLRTLHIWPHLNICLFTSLRVKLFLPRGLNFYDPGKILHVSHKKKYLWN